RDLREIQRQRLHWHAVGTGALLVAGDAGFLQLDMEVGLDLLLGGRRPLDIDLLLEGARHCILEDLRRRLIAVLADVDLLDLRVRTLEGLASGAARRVTPDPNRTTQKLEALILL